MTFIFTFYVLPLLTLETAIILSILRPDWADRVQVKTVGDCFVIGGLALVPLINLWFLWGLVQHLVKHSGIMRRRLHK